MQKHLLTDHSSLKNCFMPSKKIVFINLLFSISLQLFAQVNPVADALQHHVGILASDSLEGRGFGSKSLNKSVDYIINAFKDAGIKPLNSNYIQDFSYRQQNIRIEGRNIIGVVEGNDSVLKNEYIVLGAHYDHMGWKMKNGEKIVYNGANDNASGVASIIEIGKWLIAHHDLLKRSVILVTFDGEESGLIGSDEFVKRYSNLSDIRCMFSLDMVGTYDQIEGVDLIGIASINDAEYVVKENAKKENIKLRKTNNTISMGTDSYKFYKAGIPSVHVFTGSKSHYHQPEDDANLLDYDGMSKICNLMQNLTVVLSNKEAIIPASKIDVKNDSIYKFNIKFGTCLLVGNNHHEYEEEFYKAKSEFSAGAGLFAQLQLSNYFVLQPGACYETKGSRHEEGIFRTQSLTIPMNLLISPKINTESGMAYLLMGGYYSYIFSGAIDNKTINFNKTYNHEEWGINYGLGLQISHFQFNMFESLGLTNLYKHTIDGKMKNKGLNITLGYCF